MTLAMVRFNDDDDDNDDDEPEEFLPSSLQHLPALTTLVECLEFFLPQLKLMMSMTMTMMMMMTMTMMFLIVFHDSLNELLFTD